MPEPTTYSVDGHAFRRDWTSLKRSITLLLEAERKLAHIKASESLRNAQGTVERAERECTSARANYEMAVRRLNTTVTGVYVPYNQSLDPAE